MTGVSKYSDLTKHYADVIGSRRKSHLFSCGYHERFDPFLLDKKPFLSEFYANFFRQILGSYSCHLLDIGCGTGFYWPVLKQFCVSITGVDISEAMIAEARRLTAQKNLVNTSVYVSDIESFSPPEYSFDTILAIDLFHHVMDLRKSLQNCYRLLHKNGRMYIIEPNCLNPLMLLAHIIPKEERKALLRDYKFSFRAELRRYFSQIDHRYMNFIVSVTTHRLQHFIEAIGKIITVSPVTSWLSLRQLFVVTK